MKLWRYSLTLKPRKCRPCVYVSDFFTAVDFWDANKFVHDFLKDSPLECIDCKIEEIIEWQTEK